MSAVSGFLVQGARGGSFSSDGQAEGQERKGLPTRPAGCVTCAPKGLQEGEYTEGADACEWLLPLESAI